MGDRERLPRQRHGHRPLPAPRRGSCHPTIIGRHAEAARWTESAADQSTFLTATGPGTLAFAALLNQLQTNTPPGLTSRTTRTTAPTSCSARDSARVRASYTWHAVPPSTADEAASAEDERRARSVEATLNAARHVHDGAVRELAGLRRSLHGMWRLQGLPVLPRGYHHRQLAQELDTTRAGASRGA
ncbi:hypothetical protein ACFYN3_28450 [Streptomyces lavendulae]|uniref:hypothetical protein n=1 Tax=Streptomyces lavendulae TaxID=1914 RepID=UPI003676E593